MISNLLKNGKTFLMLAAMGVALAIFGLDLAFHDLPETEAWEVKWFSLGLYSTVLGFLGTGAGATMRIAIGKVQKQLGSK